jgi:cytochrome c
MMRSLALLLTLALPAAAQEFTTLKGHGGPIMDIAVHGDQVATASFDNSVGLWQGRVPTWLEGHAAAVVTLEIPEPSVVISGGDDFQVLLQNPALEAPIPVTQHKGKVSDIAVDPEQGRIASASWDGTVHLMTRARGLQSDGAPRVDVIPQILKGHTSGVNAVAFAPSGGLFSAGSDGSILLWEGRDGDLRGRPIVKHGFGINELIVTDTWIAYGAVDGGTRIVDHAGKEIRDFTLDRRPILALAHHAGSHRLAVGDGEGYIMMIDTRTWRISRDFRATRKGPVWALAFSQDGRVIWAGGLDDVAYGWPVDSLDAYDPAISGARSFLKAAETMPNGERQFMRKCSICHELTPGPSRKAGPTLHGIFKRRAGTQPGYRYSQTLTGSDIIWSDTTIDALFDQGPDHYIPGSKMPMQVIKAASDRAALIDFLKTATQEPPQ